MSIPGFVFELGAFCGIIYLVRDGGEGSLKLTFPRLFVPTGGTVALLRIREGRRDSLTFSLLRFFSNFINKEI